MMFPVIGGAGLAARNGAQLIDDIPVSFTEEPPARVSKVLDADGKLMTSYYNFYRVPVSINRMPESMQNAIVAIEDERFYDHNGIDTKGTLRAVVQNFVAGGVEQGGSTLTQQLVKNTLLYQAKTQAEEKAAIEPSIGRKLREAKVALEIEKKYTKKQILEKYLNLMNFGANAYGVAAAARTYFGVAVEKMTLEQSAMLAGLVQSPTAFNPLVHPDAAIKRRNLVLQAMAKSKYITQSEAEKAKKKPLGAKSEYQRPDRSCAAVANNGGFFCDYLWSYLTTSLKIPEKTLKEGGLTIKTTFKPAMQNSVTNAILGVSDTYFTLADTKIATMDVLEPGTGKVFALGVNRKYGNDPKDPGQSTVNWPTVNGEGAGSTYKLFPTVTALTNMDGINFSLTTPPPYKSKISPGYEVDNAGGYPATLPMWRALYMSSNTYFVALEDHIGSMDPIVDTATKMGLWAPGDTTISDQVKAEQQASFTLGPGSGNPLRLATAYATVAARGTKCEPTPIDGVFTIRGKPLKNSKTGKPFFTAGENCTANAISPGVADTVNQILRKDVIPGSPSATGNAAYVSGYDIAGKTGTAQGNNSYAFVGYTPKILASVLAYDPKKNEGMPGLGGGDAGYGGGYPATIWRRAMAEILPANYGTDIVFPPADPAIEKGKSFSNPVNCVGKSPQACASALSAAGLTPQQSGTPIDSDQPAGAVARQEPAVGGTVSPGQIVLYTLSTGKSKVLPTCKAGEAPSPDTCTAAPASPTSPPLAKCKPGQLPNPGKPCRPTEYVDGSGFNWSTG